MDEVVESIPREERVLIGADFNGHVGKGNRGDEDVMGRCGVSERNVEGQMVVDFSKRMNLAKVNTYFKKKEQHRVTFKSGGKSTQVDYTLCRRGNLKEIGDCKVMAGESVARQHQVVVCRMSLKVKKRKREIVEPKIKWWKLREVEHQKEFREEMRRALSGHGSLPEDWDTTAVLVREAARKVLGWSSGRRKEDKETWWNKEVQEIIKEKRLAKKNWDDQRDKESRWLYRETRQKAKRAVAKVKADAYQELYERLETKEGEKDLYRLARQRNRETRDVQQGRVMKDVNGNVLTKSVLRRWKEYFEDLLNEENSREKRSDSLETANQEAELVNKDEVRAAMKRMKTGKAIGPDGIPIEAWRCLGETAVEFLTRLCLFACLIRS
ncbi:uncharacterized protein LOC132901597 [Neoarius graeffei]|uniref:uncharacterized protein LOC132901597 n=1 Tax=Neoarius graeffei TaxID=443677 RepID=UPI00298D0878|nr:uncharacterized protein LOC132901597 [Neoarius graeffei]